jgi:hypothetical protein
MPEREPKANLGAELPEERVRQNERAGARAET